MKNRYLTIVCILIALVSCNKDNELPSATRGHEFVPQVVGKYRVYDVQTITYNGSTYLQYCDPDSIIISPGFSDTATYQIKEEVHEQYIDGQGDTSYVIYRYRRDSPLIPWKQTPDSVWTAKYTVNQFVRTENNIPFVRMGYPISKTSSWDGNAYNNKMDFTGDKIIEIYEYDSLYIEKQIGGFTFDNTVQVTEMDESDPILNKTLRYKVYAEDVGMVYSHDYLIDYCTDNPTDSGACQCSGKFITDIGHEVYYVISDFN